MLLFKQSVKGEGSAHWRTATSIRVMVFVCACVCRLNSWWNPHLLHWFMSHPPISPPDRMTAQCGLLKLNTQPLPSLVRYPSILQDSWPTELPQWDKTFIFSSVHHPFPHPPPQGPLLYPCLSELLKWIHQLSSESKNSESRTQRAPYYTNHKAPPVLAHIV